MKKSTRDETLTKKEKEDMKADTGRMQKGKRVTERKAVSGLAMLVESELEKAQVILAIQSIADKFQKIAEDLAKVEANDIMPILDSMRLTFGPQVADQFNKITTSKIRDTTESVKSSKEAIVSQLAKMQGNLDGGTPMNDMSGDDDEFGMSDDMSDDMSSEEESPELDLGDDEVGNDKDNLPASDGEELDDILNGGSDDVNAAGRPRKESIERNVRALSESKNPDQMIFKAFRKVFHENKEATKSARIVAEAFAIDLRDVIDIIKESKKEVDEGKTWKDQKDRSNKNKDWSDKREDKKRDRPSDLDEGKTWKDQKDRSNKNKDWSNKREDKKRERPSDLDEALNTNGPKSQTVFGKKKPDPLAKVPMDFKDIVKKKNFNNGFQTEEAVNDGWVKHIVAAMKDALKTIEGWKKHWEAKGDQSMVKMFDTDLSLGLWHLKEFEKTKDLDVLEKGLMDQDTAAREIFIKVFNLIDDIRADDDLTGEPLEEDFDMKPTPKSKRGMFKGKTQAELKSSLASVKQRMKSHEDKGEKVPEKLRTEFSELTFALRAKHDWGKVDEDAHLNEIFGLGRFDDLRGAKERKTSSLPQVIATKPAAKAIRNNLLKQGQKAFSTISGDGRYEVHTTDKKSKVDQVRSNTTTRIFADKASAVQNRDSLIKAGRKATVEPAGGGKWVLITDHSDSNFNKKPTTDDDF